MVLAMNKSEIIMKAIFLVNHQGLSSLTISKLAKELNVKPPSLYKHIQSLNQIHDELGMVFMKGVIQLIQTNAFGLSGEKALKEFCNSFRMYSLENPGLYQAMQLTHVIRSKQYQEIANSLLELLGRVLVSFQIQKHRQTDAIRFLRSVLHGFIDLEIHNGFGLPEDINNSFELAMEACILSLSKIY